MTREISTSCRFCGQVTIIEVSDAEIEIAKQDPEFSCLSESAVAAKIAEAKAIKRCQCDDASKFRKQEIRRNFEGFVTGDLVNFMDQNKLEEISITDAYGNKAKLKKKDSGIEVTKTLKDVM